MKKQWKKADRSQPLILLKEYIKHVLKKHSNRWKGFALNKFKECTTTSRDITDLSATSYLSIAAKVSPPPVIEKPSDSAIAKESV